MGSERHRVRICCLVNKRGIVMRYVCGIVLFASIGLLAAGFSAVPASAGLAELLGRIDHAAPAPRLDAPPLRLADRNDPRCKKCNRELDRCDQNPPYGNDRICASNYYDCIRRAHAKCD
jgi:hypothetical protein